MPVPPAAGARRTRRPAPSDRFGKALRWLRWPVLVAWVLIIVIVYPVAHSLPDVTTSNASAFLPSSAPSTRVVLLEQAAQRGRPESDPAIVIFARNTSLSTADLAAASAARAAVGRLAGRVSGLGPPGPLKRSADGRAAAFTTQITAPVKSVTSVDIAAVQAIRQAVDAPASRAGDGLQAVVAGQAAVNADSGITSGILNILLLTALLIVAVVLAIVYRSPLLWLLPLVGAIAAISLARASAHGLANAGLTVSTLSAAILTVLVLGAATDYALLLVHRYREELRRHAAAEDAMAAALRRVLPTLLASAATVVCAMICLLAARSASLHGLGPVGAVGIVSALVVQITFLPALLLACGRWVFWPRVPRQGQAGGTRSRLWWGVAARVARRPGLIVVTAVLVLGAACAGLAAIYSDNNPVAQVKGHPGSVVGAQFLAEHFPGDDTAPLVLLAPPGQAGAAVAAARATPHVDEVSSAGPVGGYTSYTAAMTVPPYSAAGYTTIANLRDRLTRAVPGALVGGDPAVQYDISQASHRDDLLLIPLVLVVIFVIIALLLRAVIAPLVLVATTALSFAAAFGLSTLLWRYGFGYSGIEAQLPLYIFIFLVALGVDYNIFLAARIHEEARDVGTTQGILRGLAVTGGVITAAGIVMAGTFADLARIPSVAVAEVGIAVALGVLLDTLLVRTVLVPAAFLTIGERIWWPARLARTSPVTGLAARTQEDVR